MSEERRLIDLTVLRAVVAASRDAGFAKVTILAVAVVVAL